MIAESVVRRPKNWLWVTGGIAAAQVLAIGLLVSRVPSALPEPVVLEVGSQSINAHSDPRRILLQDKNAVRVLDPTSHEVTASINTGASALRHGVAVHPGRDEGLVLSVNAIVRVDLGAGSVTGSTPLDSAWDVGASTELLGLDERGNLLVETRDSAWVMGQADAHARYVSSEPGVVASSGRLWVADPAAIPDLRGVRRTGVALSPDEERFYVFTDEPSVVVVDTRTGEADTMAGSRPIVGDVHLPTEDARHVVTIGGPNSTQVLVRGLGGREVAAVQADAPIVDMDISPDGATVYATTGSQLLVIDVRAYT